MMRGEAIECETAYQGRRTVTLSVSVDVLEAMAEEAERRGVTAADLARNILAVIAADKLYAAVLD